MTDVLSWDTSAASNNSAPPDGFPEGQAPSTVNNASREVMAAVKRYADDIGGVATSGGSSNAYTLSAAQSVTSYAAGQWFAFVANHANTGSATLNVNSIGAKTIKKYHDEDLVSGDIEADQVVVVYYQATDDIFEMVSQVPEQPNTPTFLRKSANYTITASDVNAPACYLAADASGGNIANIQLPTIGNLQNKIVKVYLDTDPGTNTVMVKESDGSTELWTGVEKGDFVEVTSDGTNYEVVSHYEGHYARVYVNSDESVAQGASEHIVNVAENTDVGGIWNTTNDEADIPFDCWVDLNWSIIHALDDQITAEAKLDIVYIRSAAASIGTNGRGGSTPTLSGRFKATSGQKLELWANNLDTDNGAAVVLGSATGNESFATIKLTRIY